MKQLQILLMLVAFALTASAQRFPIRVIPTVNPPAPVNFYSYADGSTLNSPLRVQLLLGDLGISNRQIRLKVYFQGNGINFQGADNVVGATPLFIDGGVPLILNNATLAPYFELQNLRGISPRTYGQTIPEGSYQFCFEVYDVIRGIQLSAKTCATTFIFKNEPPILNLPLNKSNMVPRPVDNIVFQWSPRHINVSNVVYEFSLVEIWDNHVDPQTAFLSSPPVFQTTTRATSFVYGPGQPLLLGDKRYAWQVQAKALKGAEEIGLFKNEGKSEIFWFSKTEPCDTPTNVYGEPKGLSKMNIFWDEDPTVYTEYMIAYREKGRKNSRWFTKRTNAGWATIWDLKPNTTYEYKVRGKCTFQYSAYTRPKELTTAAAEDQNANYNCGIVPDAIAITNREGHPNLLIGDRITAGDFVITITDITSEDNGIISGSGFVRVPYFEMARFGVVFDNILVNTDYQLAEGEIVTLYDPIFGENAEMVVDIPITEWLETFGDAVGELINDVKEAVDVEVATNTYIAQVQEILDDPNNGLSEEEITKQQTFIDDKDKVRDAVKQVKEDFESGKNDEVIKENLASNFADNQNTETVDTSVAELVFDIEDQYEAAAITKKTNTLIYLSPAGIPVQLPKAAKPRFLQKNSLKVAKGVLSGFTLGNEIYNGYFAGDTFRGYKTEKGGKAYEFTEIQNPNSINVVLGLETEYFDCGIIFIEGTYAATTFNNTGIGALLTGTQIQFTRQSNGLSALSTDYNSCLPDVSKISFDNYVFGKHNFFNNRGFLRVSADSSGGISYIYSVSDNEGAINHFQYNPSKGQWYLFTEPPFDCLSCDLNKMFTSLYDPSGIGHFALDAAGMIPVFGEGFDVVNGIWYTIEGDGVNATISFASTIPLVYLTSAKYIGKIVKLADGSYSVVKFGGKSTKEFLENIQRIDLDADGLKQLNKDLADKEFAEAIVENPKLVDSWKVLDGAGVDDVVRRNIDELELVSKNIDEIKAFDGGYKAWKINKAGGKFIAKTGTELRKHLDDLVDIPKGVTHEGSMYRSLTKTSQQEYGAVAEKMTDHTVYSSWGRYDLDKAENAMYLSKTVKGNKTEVTHYVDNWKAWNTYEFKNVKVDNLLDLTDQATRKKLGTQFDDLVRDVVNKVDPDLAKAENYEMTNAIASWARKKGYNGVIVPGARGAKDYHNIVLFDQSFIDDLVKEIKIEKLVK